MHKKVVIIQSNYIPWKGYFDMINEADIFVIYDEVQFTKNDWRNRNKIKSATGAQWITIPVYQNELNQKICETKVMQNNWEKKHWSSLVTNYSKAAAFKETKEVFEELYKNNHSAYLSEINYKFIKTICQCLSITTEIIWSQDLNLTGDKNERLIEACLKLNATTYISGPAAKSYINEELFTFHNIGIEWFDYSGYEEYRQLFPPFEHAVSIVDLIFNEGNNAKRFLKSKK